MRRVVSVVLVTFGLALTGGCFSRSTEPKMIQDRGALDRLKEKDGAPKEKGGKAKGKKDSPMIPD